MLEIDGWYLTLEQKIINMEEKTRGNLTILDGDISLNS